MRRAALLFVALTAWAGARAAPAPAPATTTHDVLVVGSIGFVARSTGLESLRVGLATDETGAPDARLESLDRLAVPGSVLGLDVDGDRLYAAVGTLGVLIIDRSDPERMRILGRLNTDGRIGDVRVRDDRALLAAGRDGLLVVDVSKPEQPLPGAGSPGRGDARRLALDGTRLALAEDRGGVRLFDVTRPDVPRRLASLDDLDGRARDVALRGDLLAVACAERGVALYRLARDGGPRRLATLDIGHRAEGLSWHGDLLLVGTGGGHLVAIDVADPEHARVRGAVLVHRRARTGRVASFDRLVLVPAGIAGLVLVDLVDPDDPVVIERGRRPMRIAFPDEAPTIDFDR